VGQRRAVLRGVAANPALRRVEAASLGFGCVENGVWVSVLVYAYERGGTAVAAAIAVLQLLPAAAVAPLASTLTDRRGGAVGLWTGYVAQALSVGATALLLLSGAPAAAVYAAAVLAACAVTLTRPAQAALLPTLVDDPRQLTAANALGGWLESMSFLLGPAAAGALIGLDGPGLSCALFAGTAALAAALVAPLAARAWTAPQTTEHQKSVGDHGRAAAFRLLRSEPGIATLVVLVALQYIALGALDVLVVVLAIKLLALGASGAGYLNAAFGAGGVAGGILTIGLIGRARLAPPLIAGAIAWGAAFLLLGAWPTAVGAFLLFAAAGASRMLLDVSGRTLLQRTTPAYMRGRVFGVLEGGAMLGLAIGSASVPLLALAGGPRTSVAGIGALLVVTAVAVAHLLARLERTAPTPSTELALLRGSSIFGVLAAPQLEALARSLVLERAPAGVVVIREGDRGDRFYLVADGSLGVSVDGAERGRLQPGDGFGEIALLRDGVRTATVTTREPVTLYTLDRSSFLEAVTGSPHARRAAERVAAERLDEDRESVGVVGST
jgi:hypothetical protein